MDMKLLKYFLLCILFFTETSIQAKQQDGLFACHVQEKDLSRSEEILYLQTDKGIYESGEDLWFKGYVFDKATLALSEKSRTLFVEMLDSRDSIVWQEKYPIQSGIADGHIYVDRNLRPGDYRIHAYTRYSFLKDTLRAFYPKLIRVVRNITEKVNVPSPEKEGKVSRLSFFPEGGSLIDGIPSRVAFKGSDGKGMPVEVRGVLQENGKDVARLESLHDGMGVFMLYPHQGSVYQAVLDDSTVYSFPEVRISGMSLQLRRQTDEYLDFYLFQSGSAVPCQVRLTGKMRGRLCCMAEGTLHGSLKVRIPLRNLPMQGIAEFTLYDGAMRPVAERLVYVHPKKRLHIELHTDKERYMTREKGSLQIRVTDGDGHPVRAHLGLSLFDSAYLNGSSPENMLSYCLLSTEIRGNIHNPAYYFDEANKNRLQVLDLLLLTQGWRRYVWTREDSTAVTFLPDVIQGRQVIGKKKHQKELGGDRQQLLRISGPDTKSQFVMTDSMGKFTIPADQMLALRGGYTYLQPMLDKDKYKPVLLFEDDFVRADSLRSRCRFYRSFRNQEEVPAGTGFDDMVISRDSSIMLSEVTVTGTKGKVFRDKMMGRLDSLAQLQVGVSAWVCGCGSGKITYLNDYKGYSHHPEGCPCGPPKKRVPPVPGETYRLIKYEPVGGNGKWIVTDIQSITWTGKEFTEEELLRMNNMYRVKGYYGKREFYEPDELEMQTSVPDARNVLLWKPDIITDEQGKAKVDFFCSDINTIFIGIIEGTDGTGGLGTFQCEFRVLK